jgi:hypothetical protein
MDDVDIGHFLRDQLTRPRQAMLPPTLRTAYKAAADLAKDEPILEVASAADNRGRLVSWAVDVAIERLIKTGKWPFDYEWKYFEKPTGRYLQIQFGAATMSVSQVERPKKPPRHALFRGNAAMMNYKFLFPEMEERRKIDGLPAFVLIHGHQELNFIHIGMAYPRRRKWLYRTPNLLLTPHAIESTEPPIEAQDEESIITLKELKEEIAKWRRDSNV